MSTCLPSNLRLKPIKKLNLLARHSSFRSRFWPSWSTQSNLEVIWGSNSTFPPNKPAKFNSSFLQQTDTWLVKLFVVVYVFNNKKTEYIPSLFFLLPARLWRNGPSLSAHEYSFQYELMKSLETLKLKWYDPKQYNLKNLSAILFFFVRVCRRKIHSCTIFKRFCT